MLEGNLSILRVSSEDYIVTARVVVVFNKGGHVSLSFNLNFEGNHLEVSTVVLV